MENLSRKERIAFSEQFFGKNCTYNNSSTDITDRLELLRALHATGLVPLLIKNRMLFTPYDHWLRWADLYQQLSEGKSRKNGARDKVLRFFEQYYSDNPEWGIEFTIEKFERMQKVLKKLVIK